jgi:putative FmdB family regulatory protein
LILYVFRCETGCGTTQQMHSMHSRPDVVECPDCGGSARRMIAAPHLSSADGTAMALHDATRATADRPGVVSAPESVTRRRPVSANPLHRKLPRP